jgi:hypothetical protein
MLMMKRKADIEGEVETLYTYRVPSRMVPSDACQSSYDAWLLELNPWRLRRQRATRKALLYHGSVKARSYSNKIEVSCAVQMGARHGVAVAAKV